MEASIETRRSRPVELSATITGCRKLLVFPVRLFIFLGSVRISKIPHGTAQILQPTVQQNGQGIGGQHGSVPATPGGMYNGYNDRTLENVRFPGASIFLHYVSARILRIARGTDQTQLNYVDGGQFGRIPATPGIARDVHHNRMPPNAQCTSVFSLGCQLGSQGYLQG